MPAVGNELSHVFDGATVRGGLALVGDAGSTVYLNRDTASATARQQIVSRAMGYYTETFPRATQNNANSVTISGTVYFMAVGLLAGDVVSSMTVLVQTVASAATLAKVGLYSKAGTLLASSADASASFGTATPKTIALSTPYTVPTDDAYYAAFINVAGTGAALIRSTSGIVAALSGAINGGIGCAGTQTGQADLPASATIAFTGSNIYYWMAIS